MYLGKASVVSVILYNQIAFWIGTGVMNNIQDTKADQREVRSVVAVVWNRREKA